MTSLLRLTTFISRRCQSTVAAFSEGYKAVNEPVLEYLEGSKERTELEAKLKEYNEKVFDIPIVIGDAELTTSDVHFQVKPHDHKSKLSKFYYADKTLLKSAIDVSQKAHKSWMKTSLEHRAEIFLKAADLIAGKYRMDMMAATMLGQGKTIIQGEIDTAAELIDFYRFNVEYAFDMRKWQPISVTGTDNTIEYRPVEGFWAAIAPFNFTAISGHLAGAPAFMGNVVLWKPSDTAMLSSYICFKILLEAGVPPGVINFTPSDGPVFGDAICSSPLLAGLNFTGSAKTFQYLWKEVANRIENFKSFPRLIGECGGKNFHFIHKSADVDSVVNGTIRSAFEYSGQKCSACSRMYVPQSLWPEMKQKLLNEHSKLKLGPPNDPKSFLSAVIDDKSFSRIQSYLEHAKSSPNVNVIAGGGCDDSEGYYVEPTIVETSDPADKLITEEIFGPVLTVYPYPDEEVTDILKVCDSTTDYALTGAVFSKDESFLEEARDILAFTTGNLYVNDKSTGSVVAQQPFGGARKSGTNDKAGSPHYLYKFVSPQSVKTTKVPLSEIQYAYMQ